MPRGHVETLPTLNSTCMVTLRDLFVKLIHSQGITDRISTNLRASLIGYYESHWSRFVEYCLRKCLNVFEVDCKSFSKYLLYLFEVDGYVLSTIISHWTFIASLLKHWKYGPANDLGIGGMLPNFQLAQPVQRKMMPQWNLHLILSALLWPPFSSMVQSIDPAMTSLTKNGGHSKQHFCCWLLPGRTRCLIRLSGGYVFPGIAHLKPDEPERMLCCVVMWIHHLVRRCGCAFDQWTVFLST